MPVLLCCPPVQPAQLHAAHDALQCVLKARQLASSGIQVTYRRAHSSQQVRLSDELQSVQVRAVKSNSLANVRIGVEKLICVETFAHVPQLGRFTLRNEGATIAIGKITELPKSEKADAPEAK